MTISLVLAWFAAFFMIVTILKFVARKFGNDETNKFFRKIHKQIGIAMVVAGLLHGIFAGNPSWSTLGDFAVAPILFTFNWGTVLLLLSIALGVTFVLRKKLKKHWMTAHRVLTIVAMIVFVLHLLDVGIQLPDRIAEAFNSRNNETELAVIDKKEDNNVTDDTNGKTDDTNVNTDDTNVNTDDTNGKTDGSSNASDKTDGQSNEDSSQDNIKDSSQENSGQDTLKESENDGTDNSNTESNGQTDEEKNDNVQSNILFSGAVLKDGTYTGQADGYNGTIEVSVVVEGGSVTSIIVTSERDTPQFFSRAENVLDSILSAQSLEVDAVTGATFSSAGLINAVDNALQSAVIEGTLSKTEIDTTNVRRHGHGR